MKYFFIWTIFFIGVSKNISSFILHNLTKHLQHQKPYSSYLLLHHKKKHNHDKRKPSHGQSGIYHCTEKYTKRLVFNFYNLDMAEWTILLNYIL